MTNPNAAEKVGAASSAGATAEKAAAAAAPASKVEKARPEARVDAEEPRRVTPLQVTRWQIGEFMNTRHSVSPASGTPFDDLLRPEFWANITRMAAGDIIEVRPEDQSYYAELYVLRRERTSATVAVIRGPLPLEAAYKARPGEVKFTVEFAGSMAKWRVVRKSDKAVMRDRFGTEGEARAWLADYERLVSA